jgi:glutamine amidotransferase
VIAVVDYGMGNLSSVQNGLKVVGAEGRATSDPKEILNAKAVILPGVGAFKDCMSNLEKFGLVDCVQKSAQSGKPFLGICLGLQLLFSESEEFGSYPGLNLIPGKVKKFQFSDENRDLKIPHMGWNRVKFQRESSLFEGVPDDSYFYFVHSYYVVPENPNVVAATANYGGDFVCGIRRDNIYAFQFHPEKSQKLGLTLLKNFSALAH